MQRVPGIDKSALINLDGRMERAKELILPPRRVGPRGDQISLDPELAEPVGEITGPLFPLRQIS